MLVIWCMLAALGLMGEPQEPRGEEKKPTPTPQDLEERLRRLEAASKEKQVTPFDPSKMLSFAGADGNFTAKVGGRIYFAYRHIFDRDDGTGGAADTFSVDTARVQLDGTFYKDYYYRVETESQSSSDAGRHRLKDTYLGWVAIPDYLSIQGGQMKVPWSQEESCSSRFIEFGERSILNRLAPAHDAGLMARGALEGKMLEWNLGLFNMARTRDGGRNTVDANDEKMVALRLFTTPMADMDLDPLFKNIRLGFDYTRGDIDGNSAHGDITTGDLGGVTFADFNGTTNIDGIQERQLLNFSWIYGPASIRAEYAIINQELVSTAPEGDFDIEAWSVHGTFLLTGESKALENRVKPAENFSIPQGTLGAIELAVRIAEVEVADEAITGGVFSAVVGGLPNSRKTRELAVGINWWWTPNVALRLNWERFIFDEEVRIGTTDSPEKTQDVLYARWQIDF